MQKDNTKWTWAPYGPKTVGIGLSGWNGGGAQYIIRTGELSSTEPKVVADMNAMCAGLNQARKGYAHD